MDTMGVASGQDNSDAPSKRMANKINARTANYIQEIDNPIRIVELPPGGAGLSRLAKAGQVQSENRMALS